jgi:hypothetical protein
LRQAAVSGISRGKAAGKGSAMDYGKSGAANMAKKTPRHKEHNEPGSNKNPFGKRPSKEELVAKLKAAAEAKKAEGTN